MMCPFATTETDTDSSTEGIGTCGSSARHNALSGQRPPAVTMTLHLGAPHTSLTCNGSTPRTQPHTAAGRCREGHTYTAQLQTKEYNVYNYIRVEMTVETSSLKLVKVSDIPT